MRESPNEEQIREWKNHPVGKWYFLRLRELADEGAKQLGYSIGSELTQETLLKTARVSGQLAGIAEVIEFDLEKIDGED